ncbi:MAG: hypothetical protein ACFFD4_19425 [Candidatus Odinarchaeota archaeon]
MLTRQLSTCFLIMLFFIVIPSSGSIQLNQDYDSVPWIGEDFYLQYDRQIHLYRDGIYEKNYDTVSWSNFTYQEENGTYLLRRSYHVGTFLPHDQPNTMHIQANLTIDINTRTIIGSQVNPDTLNFTGRKTVHWLPPGVNAGDVVGWGTVNCTVEDITDREIGAVVNHTTESSESYHQVVFDKESYLLIRADFSDKFVRNGIPYKIISQLKLLNSSLDLLEQHLPRSFINGFEPAMVIFLTAVISVRRIKKRC